MGTDLASLELLPINDGSRYVSQVGYCPKAFYLLYFGESPELWDRRSIERYILQNQFINKHLDNWLILEHIEKALSSGEIDGELAKEVVFGLLRIINRGK